MHDWPQIIINIVAAQYPLHLSSILLERIAFFYTCCLRSYNSFRSLIDILIVCLPTKLYLEENNYFFLAWNAVHLSNPIILIFNASLWVRGPPAMNLRLIVNRPISLLVNYMPATTFIYIYYISRHV